MLLTLKKEFSSTEVDILKKLLFKDVREIVFELL